MRVEPSDMKEHLGALITELVVAALDAAILGVTISNGPIDANVMPGPW
jgi:hypothetical protein